MLVANVIGVAVQFDVANRSFLQRRSLRKIDYVAGIGITSLG
jgi:hypothetical protein